MFIELIAVAVQGNIYKNNNSDYIRKKVSEEKTTGFAPLLCSILSASLAAEKKSFQTRSKK